MTTPIAAGRLDRRVGGDTAIYALFDPAGKLRRCGETLDIATNYLVEGMAKELWNGVFGKPAKTRVQTFERHGWKVLQGTFTPNVEHNRRPPGVRIDGPVGPHTQEK